MIARPSALVAPLAMALTSLGGAAAASTEPAPLLAHQTPLVLDSAATGWVLTSTALVLMMTLPGLALFYGGMVRKKNIIATIAQSALALMIVTVLWFLVGYSLAFSTGPGQADAVIGGLQAAFLDGVTLFSAHRSAQGLPEYAWIAYQLTFAVIAPAIIAGAFAERMKVSAALLFFGLWHLIVYVPVCHMVWGGGWLERIGVLDFAGGSVIHVSAGVSGLVCALVLGPRHGFGRDNMAPSNLALTAIGTGLLFVGWLGLNAGSAHAADGVAALAALNTLVAPAAAALAWMVVEWIQYRRPTLLGLLSGMVAGLVAVTPGGRSGHAQRRLHHRPGRRAGLLPGHKLAQAPSPLRRQPRRLGRPRPGRRGRRPADRRPGHDRRQSPGCRSLGPETADRPRRRDRLERPRSLCGPDDLPRHHRPARPPRAGSRGPRLLPARRDPALLSAALG